MKNQSLQAFKQILLTLKQDKNAKEFLKPVDYNGLHLYDYITVISKPMDLDTVSRNFKTGKYKTAEEVVEDINLIWTNCMKYNVENSGIYLQAKKMQKLTFKLCKRIL